MSSTVTETRPAPTSGLREVVGLAWPLVLTNGCWTAQIVLDRVFLAWYSDRDLAASLPGVMFFWAVFNLFFHTASYVATFVAQYTGAGRPGRIGPAVGQALYFSLLGGVLFAIAAPFTATIVTVSGHSAELQQQEAIFLRCLCFGALPELVKVTTFSFFNGRGESRKVLAISVVTLAVNAVVGYCWIFGYGGFPRWGIAGAGWATVTASTVAALLGLALMLRERYRKECGMANVWRFEPALFARLLRFGVPNGFFMAADTAAFSVFVLIVGRLGEHALAASNVAFTINLVAILPTLGIGTAVEVLVGRHLGADRPDLAENRTWIGFGLAWGLMSSAAAVFFFAPSVALLPFSGEVSAETTGAAEILLRFVALYTLFDSANLIFSFALRGAGDTKFVMCVMSFLPWLGMVLPVVLMYRQGWGGLYTAWAIVCAYVCALACVFLSRFLYGAWKSMRVIEAAGPAE